MTNHSAEMAVTDPQPSNRLLQILKLLSLDPTNRALNSDCISLALHERCYDIALGLASDLLAKNPADAQAQFEYASALMGKRQFDQALVALNGLTQLSEVPLAVWQNIGLCHYIQGDYAATFAALEKVFDGGVRSADLARLLVSSLHHLGAMERALMIAGESHDLARKDGALAGVLALLYLDADEPAQAARWSARAVAANPNSIDGLVVQGTLRTASFDLPTARRQFEKVISTAPATARAWVGLSMVSLAENDLPQARTQIQKGLQHMPQHVGSWHVLAWIDLMQNNLEDAGLAFERALSLDRNFAESHGGLAAIAALKGDRPTAEHLIEIAERLDTACLSAKFARSTLLKGVNDSQGARDSLITALSGLSPKDGGAISKVIEELTQPKR